MSLFTLLRVSFRGARDGCGGEGGGGGRFVWCVTGFRVNGKWPKRGVGICVSHASMWFIFCAVR